MTTPPDPITPESIETILIEAATRGDFYVPNAGHVWRIDDVRRENSTAIEAVALYAHREDQRPKVTQKVGTQIRVIRRAV